jgi:hypothetical protein
MTEELTSAEKAVAKRAAKRYGLVAPTFVDVIDELTPEYANFNGSTSNAPCTNRAIVRRWHRIAAYAMDLVAVQRSGRKPQHRRPKKELPECAADGCSKKVKESRSKYCSHSCSGQTKRLRTCHHCKAKYKSNNSRGYLVRHCSPECAKARGQRSADVWHATDVK